MSFEDQVGHNIFSQQVEKTYIDKLLARKDVDDLRELVRKDSLKREDILDIMYLLTGVESKLVNYGEWDRYIMLKLFVWLREFVKISELLFDYKDDLLKKEEDGKLKLSARTKQLLENNRRLNEHNIKFLVDLYVNISRTTLSLGATGILEILKNKYEISYPNAQTNMTQPEPSRFSMKNMRVGAK